MRNTGPELRHHMMVGDWRLWRGKAMSILPDTSVARRAPLLALLLLVFNSDPGRAQTLEGRVLDGGSRQPISDARLTLLHPDGRALGEPVFSGETGSFILAVPGIGEYYLRVDRTSYTPIVEGIFEFTAPTGRMEVEIFILPQPIQIEGFDIGVDRPQVRRHLRSQGFYQRANEGFGDFITPAMIEQQGPTTNVSDYIRRVPGLNFYGGLVLFKSASSRLENENGERIFMCEPNVWVDGVQMTKATYDNRLQSDDLEQSLDDYVNALDVVAIEVYRRASATPLQWGGINGGSCGTIVIWTQAGG